LKNLLTLIFLVLFFNTSAFSQSNSEDQVRLSAEFGLGKEYIVDEIISKNEYTGYPLFYGLSWEDLNSFRETGISFSFSKAKNLKNRNTKAELSEFLFEYYYIYKIDTLEIFSLPVKFFLGPGVGAYGYNRSQKVASFIETSSDFGSLCLNINSKFVFDLTSDIVFKFDLSSALITYTNGDRKSKTDKSSGLFLFYSNLMLNSRVSIEYFISKNIFIDLQYRFDYLRRDELNNIRSINDRIILQMGWSF
jgi:hypothetical protein